MFILDKTDTKKKSCKLGSQLVYYTLLKKKNF